MSLFAAGLYQSSECAAWRAGAQKLAEHLIRSEWQSANLKQTPFTIAFVLEAVTLLCELDVHLDASDAAMVAKAELRLKRALKDRKCLGAIAIKEYPPTAYVTQLVTRVLDRRKALGRELRILVRAWAAKEITRQTALYTSVEKLADCYALAYSAILLASLSRPSDSDLAVQQLSPEEAGLLHGAIDLLFAKQLPDGSWPPSQPLFRYPREGNAYCYEYEMLVQLLSERTLHPLLLKHLDKLALAAYPLKDRTFLLPSGALAWASGHHPQDPGPESWATASVFHFANALDRLVAEGVRRELFRYLNQEYQPPLEPRADYGSFAPGLLDSNITLEGQQPQSLREVLLNRFVRPIAESAQDVALGRPFSEKVKISAIFFGPPGTSKTKLTEYIAQFLQWPRLVIDPSHLVRKGMDLIQAEANTLFDMIAAAERIVVLFDEFDEIVRERTSENTEMISRLLTTAMLPKLSQIYDRRRVVFILATNHLEQFDFAISRLGRFDRIFQVMPPTATAKLAHWKQEHEHLKEIGTNIANLEKDMGVLIFKEFEEMAPELMKAQTSQGAAQVVEEFARKSTLRQKPIGSDDTWEVKSFQQRVRNRF